MKRAARRATEFHVLTLFPHIFDSYLDESLMRRARAKKIISVTAHDLRTFIGSSKERPDDRPFGGGPGMVLKVEPIHRAIKKIVGGGRRHGGKKKTRVILFSTRGNKLDANSARRLSRYDRLILICGHYEGVDERVAERLADEELSIGDYVLSGGELPALVAIEAISRFKPGFLGKFESLEEIKGSYPVYTRPGDYPAARGKHWKVPLVLLSGDHTKIERWRRNTGSP